MVPESDGKPRLTSPDAFYITLFELRSPPAHLHHLRPFWTLSRQPWSIRVGVELVEGVLIGAYSIRFNWGVQY